MVVNSKIVLLNGNVILENEIVSKNIYICNGKIVEISSRKSNDETYFIDAKGMYVSPGFIDVHTHGRGGCDTMYDNYEDLNTITKYAVKSGTTSFLPTTITMPVEDIKKAVENVAINMDKVEGAKILGVHIEGPFFCEKYKGAQPSEFMIPPSIENFGAIVGRHIDIVKKISLAPELDGSERLIEFLINQGIIVSMAHTNATYDEAKKVIDMGVNSGTHTFNAMSPLNHRNPGVVGAVLENDDVYAELILDGVLVSYPAARILLKAKGVDKLVLITDSLEAAGLGDGEFKLANHALFVDDGVATLSDGTLAGSVLGMNDAVRNAIENLPVTMCEAVKMASKTPAESIGLKNTGQIKEGFQADIVLFDEDINVKMTMVDGVVKYSENFEI